MFIRIRKFFYFLFYFIHIYIYIYIFLVVVLLFYARRRVGGLVVGVGDVSEILITFLLPPSEE